jgi:hypothetical protein
VLICPSFPEIAAAYVDAYIAASDVSRERIQCWLPFVAAARLAEGVPDEAGRLMKMASLTTGETG